MSPEQLGNFPGMAESWPKVQMPVKMFLLARLRLHVRAKDADGAKAVEQILADLETLGSEKTAPVTPRMKPLNSLSESGNQQKP